MAEYPLRNGTSLPAAIGMLKDAGMLAPTVPAESLIESGECSAQCLLAREPDGCECRCGGTYHGTLVGTLVVAPEEPPPPDIDPEDVIALALSSMPPAALRLALLELCGWPTSRALKALGVSRSHKYRVLAERDEFMPERLKERRRA